MPVTRPCSPRSTRTGPSAFAPALALSTRPSGPPCQPYDSAPIWCLLSCFLGSRVMGAPVSQPSMSALRSPPAQPHPARLISAFPGQNVRMSVEERKHRKGRERRTPQVSAPRAEQPSVISRVHLRPSYRAPHPRRLASADTVPVCRTCQPPREVGGTPATMLQT